LHSNRNRGSAQPERGGAKWSNWIEFRKHHSRQWQRCADQTRSRYHIPAQLTKSLDAKKAKAGDGVEAKTWEDVLSDGIVIVPRGSKLIGHLTEAQAPASAKKASQLSIVFDQVLLKSGQELAVNATILSLTAPPEGQRAFSRMSSGDNPMDRARGPWTPAPGAKESQSSPPHAVNEPLWSKTAPGLRAETRSSGIQDFYLSSAVSGSTRVSVISSPTRNVKLEKETMMSLRVESSGQ